MTSSEHGQLGTAVSRHKATSNDDTVCLLIWTAELLRSTRRFLYTIHLTSRLLEPLLPTAFVCHFQVQCFCEHTSISTVFLIMVTQVPPSVASYWPNALAWWHKPPMIIIQYHSARCALQLKATNRSCRKTGLSYLKLEKNRGKIL